MHAPPRISELFTSVMVACAALFQGSEAGQACAAAPHKPPAVFSCAPAPRSDFTVDVKDPMYGAMGDGRTDDSFAIQKAVNSVAGTGGTVRIPAGIYLINPVINDHAGIRLGNDLTLKLDRGAVLQVLPTSVSRYVLRLASGVRNVTICGGTLVGNRAHNTITDPAEAGFGIEVANSRHEVVDGVTIRDCWADGIYITANAQDVTLCQVVAESNRRNGLSVVSVDGMVVRGSTFAHSTGSIENGAFANGSGIDLEPNLGQTVANVQIVGCKILSNPSIGIAVGPAVAHTGRAFTTQVIIDGNIVTGTKAGSRGTAFGI